jgi:hypothetical protein
MAFELTVTKTQGTIEAALKEAKIEGKPGDVHMYEIAKKEKVSDKKVVALVKGEEAPVTGDEARKQLGLPTKGNGQVEPKNIPKDFRGFVQSTSHNRKMPKGASILLLRDGAAKAPAKRKAEDAPKKPVTKSAKTGVDINKLLEKFKANGKVDPPVAEKDLPKGKMPEELKAMMLASGQWLLEKKNEDDFAVEMLNFFEKGKLLNKVEMFGDEDMVQDWATEPPDGAKPNCAEEGWECFATAGDSHFLFVDMASGATRCANIESPEDEPLTAAPFSDFMHLLEDYSSALEKQDTKGGDDPLDFMEYARDHVKA